MDVALGNAARWYHCIVSSEDWFNALRPLNLPTVKPSPTPISDWIAGSRCKLRRKLRKTWKSVSGLTTCETVVHTETDEPGHISHRTVPTGRNIFVGWSPEQRHRETLIQFKRHERAKCHNHPSVLSVNAYRFAWWTWMVSKVGRSVMNWCWGRWRMYY